ncbi:MAG TPA: heme-binding domain-containing protein, partial [Chitinophagaceae bacterium]
NHIKEGKHELNFTEFATYSPKKQGKKLEEIRETVESGEMPLKSYLVTHGDARLTEVQKKTLVAWAKGVSGE